MTSSSLRERIARLGPVQAVGRVASGSPVGFILVPRTDRAGLRTVTAAIELARRGVSLLRAKRALEEMIERGRAYVRLPEVEDAAALVHALEGCGIGAVVLGPPAFVDVRAIREGLGLTQEQFALRFGLDPDAVRNWESARRVPDTAARSYLQVIARDPGGVERALIPATG